MSDAGGGGGNDNLPPPLVDEDSIMDIIDVGEAPDGMTSDDISTEIVRRSQPDTVTLRSSDVFNYQTET